MDDFIIICPDFVMGPTAEVVTAGHHLVFMAPTGDVHLLIQLGTHRI